MKNSYGKELILDLKECDITLFTRECTTQYFIELCDLMKMKREKLEFWDYEGEPEEYKKAPDHLKGTTAVQFITTSNITIHALDVSKQVLINIFSCKDYYSNGIIDFSRRWFKGKVLNCIVLERGAK